MSATTVARSIRRGAFRGFQLGLLVAGVEAVFLSLFCWIARGATNYVPQTASEFAVSAVAFTLVGTVWGAIAGWSAFALRSRIGDADFDEWLELAVTFGLALAFLVHTLADGWPSSAKFEVPFELSTVATIVLFAALVRRRPRAIIGGYASRWPVAIALVGSGWIVTEPLGTASDAVQVGGAVLAAFAVAAIARAIHRRRPRWRASSGFLVVLIALAGWSFSGLLEEAPNVAKESRSVQRADASSPNVLVISLDTTRADHMSIYGYERDTTPQLREFCKESIRFLNAVSAADLTLSSHASLFTGLYPQVHGANPDGADPHGRPLAERFDTMAEILGAEGFRTIGVVANHGYLGHGFGLDQGFDFYDDRSPVPTLPNPPNYALRKRVIEFLRPAVPEAAFDMTYRRANQLVDELIGILDRQHANGERTFTFLNLMDAHAPYDAPPPWNAKFANGKAPVSYPEFQALTDDVNAEKETLGAEVRERLLAQYDGGIAFADAQVGRLFAHLKEIGEWDRTLIVVFGDHGESFGDHSRMSHGVSVYQDQLHVPLLVKLAGSKEPRTVRDYVSLVDVLPTVLAELHIGVSTKLPGKSLLAPADDAPRAIFGENHPTASLAKLHVRFQAPQRAVVLEKHKLIQNADGSFEMYDLANDPDEHTPTSDRSRPMMIRLVDALAHYLNDAPAGSDDGEHDQDR